MDFLKKKCHRKFERGNPVNHRTNQPEGSGALGQAPSFHGKGAETAERTETAGSDVEGRVTSLNSAGARRWLRRLRFGFLLRSRGLLSLERPRAAPRSPAAAGPPRGLPSPGHRHVRRRRPASLEATVASVHPRGRAPSAPPRWGELSAGTWPRRPECVGKSK